MTAFHRLNDQALLAHINEAVAAARDRSLDDALLDLLGETLREIKIEGEARKAMAGEASLFEALPSVIEAREGAA